MATTQNQQQERQGNSNSNERQPSALFRSITTSKLNGETTDNFERYLQLINNCDEDDPLLSETPLGQHLSGIPLNSLAPNELAQVYLALNVEQLIPTEAGLMRDYRGFSELLGFSSLELESRFKRSHNPSKSLLEASLLQARLYDETPPQRTSVNYLLKLLEKLERFDIIDDLLPQLVRWAATAAAARQAGRLYLFQEDCRSGREKQIAARPTTQPTNDQMQSNTQSRGELYDAFVCFAPEDFHYAQELIKLLEFHNKRLITVDNLLPGRFEYDAIVQMIATECRKVIVILTPNYLLSKDCEFQTKFANELAIKSGWNPKIIPVLFEPFDDAQLPYLLRFMSKIDLTSRPDNQVQWQLKKLLFSLEHENHQAAGVASVHHDNRLGSRTANHTQIVQQQQQQQQRPMYDLVGQDARHQRFTPDNDYVEAAPIVDLAYSHNSSSDLNSSSQLLSNSSLMLTTSCTIMTTATTSRPTSPFSGGGGSGGSHLFSDDARLQVTSYNNSAMAAGGGGTVNYSTQQQQQQQNQLNPMNWYKSIKQRVRGLRSSSESMSPPSTSSRAILLPPGDSDENLAADATQAVAVPELRLTQSQQLQAQTQPKASCSPALAAAAETANSKPMSSEAASERSS